MKVMMGDGLIYTHMENGIHRLYWKDSKPTTIDAYVRLLVKLQETLAEDSVVRVLYDYRDTGTPSFSTLMNAMKNFKTRGDLTLRIAHLYSDLMYPMIMKNATLVAQVDANRRFFKADEEQEAIEWLLNDE